jgi:hypothetical protein
MPVEQIQQAGTDRRLIGEQHRIQAEHRRPPLDDLAGAWTAMPDRQHGRLERRFTITREPLGTACGEPDGLVPAEHRREQPAVTQPNEDLSGGVGFENSVAVLPPAWTFNPPSGTAAGEPVEVTEARRRGGYPQCLPALSEQLELRLRV